MLRNEKEQPWQQTRVEKFSETLNSHIINMDNYSEQKLKINDFLIIDEKKYKDYLDQYIKVPQSPDVPIWEIFSKQIIDKQF